MEWHPSIIMRKNIDGKGLLLALGARTCPGVREALIAENLDKIDEVKRLVERVGDPTGIYGHLIVNYAIHAADEWRKLKDGP